MEARILEAEQELSARQCELQEAAAGGRRLEEAYQKVQEAQGLIEDLYARWAELEIKVAR